MAPEQEGGLAKQKGGKHDSSYDSKADIFSLGIVLFEMFHAPFETVSMSSRLVKIVWRSLMLFASLVSTWRELKSSPNYEGTTRRLRNQHFTLATLKNMETKKG